MKEVKAYKTSDGNIWEDSIEAESHQRSLDLKVHLEEFVHASCWSGMSGADVAEVIYVNRYWLLEILGGK